MIPRSIKSARPYTTATSPVSKQKVNVRVVAREGQPLELEWCLPARPDVRIRVVSDAPLAAAQNRGLTIEFLREQLGRLGNTPYELGELELESEGSPFAPSSLLNHLRRQAVEKLVELQSKLRTIEIHDPAGAVEQLLPAPKPAAARRDASSIFWSAPRSNWMPPSNWRPPASRSIIWICTACGPRSTA